jgi:hypothetical protein
MSDLDDGEEGYYKDLSTQEIIDRILEITEAKDKIYDILYTHGENGEYGHIRHIEVHKAVDEMLSRGLLLANEVFFFSYKKVGEDCNLNKSADKLIRLEKPYFKMKKKLIEKAYGFQKGGFEEKSCGEVEGFDIRK